MFYSPKKFKKPSIDVTPLVIYIPRMQFSLRKDEPRMLFDVVVILVHHAAAFHEEPINSLDTKGIK